MDEFIEEDNDAMLDLSDDPRSVAICSCGLHEVRGGNLYCDMCLVEKDFNS